MADQKAPLSVVITDANGLAYNLGNATGTFTGQPISIVATDSAGHGIAVGTLGALPTTNTIGWSDVALSRSAAGVMALGNGAQGDTTGNLQLNQITKYSGTALVGAGVPSLVAKFDATAQAANIGSTLLYAVPASGAGSYRFSAYVVITQAATTSSTLAAAQVQWTDNDTNVVETLSITNNPTSNTVGTQGGTANLIVFNAKASTNINIQTAGYASSGVTPMQYAVHIKLEYLG